MGEDPVSSCIWKTTTHDSEEEGISWTSNLEKIGLDWPKISYSTTRAVSSSNLNCGTIFVKSSSHRSSKRQVHLSLSLSLSLFYIYASSPSLRLVISPFLGSNTPTTAWILSSKTWPCKAAIYSLIYSHSKRTTTSSFHPTIRSRTTIGTTSRCIWNRCKLIWGMLRFIIDWRVDSRWRTLDWRMYYSGVVVWACVCASHDCYTFGSNSSI